MSPRGSTRSLATPDGNNVFDKDSSPKYTPRFSAATQMILERIQSGNNSSYSSMAITATSQPLPGYEDMRRSVLQNMKTSISMDLTNTTTEPRRPNINPARSVSVGAPRTAPTGTSATYANTKVVLNTTPRSNGKRKRENIENDESDGNLKGYVSNPGESNINESEIVGAPKVTQSGRHIVKPIQFAPATFENAPRRRAPARKIQEQALCKRCGRGHGPINNLIVFCDGCNLPWHQKCHEPIISETAVQDEGTAWFCAGCSRKRGIISGYETRPNGVSWAEKGIEEKRAYLKSLPQSQLVSLLIQATSLHPDIPIFPKPTPLKTTSSLVPSPSPSYISPTPLAGPYSRTTTEPFLPLNITRRTQSPVPNVPTAHTYPPSSAQVHMLKGEGSRESTPASPPYPRAGKGLMASLGPDEDDLEWLVDADDYEAFSHSVYEGSEGPTGNSQSLPPIGVSIRNGAMISRGGGVGGMEIGI
ncbi:BgTH12-06735 [Blumeria graminis f. sp. triticale]|uniref:BgTH12-06735 n=1 Tax=Blumeria graminis f. sp. triticale TaxID=1689686 RepID=A0A9W4GEN1_BLUGR|nr:BgTH12-06735 [Blumeria graminis f. sp. triticale]